MNIKSIDRIILKFLEDRTSEKENAILKDWLKDPENQLYFERFVEINYFLQKKKTFHFKESLDDALSKISLVKRIIVSRYLKYAAVFICFLGLSYFFKEQYFYQKTEIVLPNELITLKLEDGTVKILDDNSIGEESSFIIVGSNGNTIGVQNGNQLVYSNKNNKNTLEYNTLNVPYGKRFNLVLSDGTKVNLNSGTSFRYPANFILGHNREVYVDGEAYFDVVKDKEHPFIVHAHEQNIRVLGTQFNVSNYEEDSVVSTVLVEGSVSLYIKGIDYFPEESLVLKPGYKAEYDKEINETTTEKVDTQIFTAWTEGKLIFRNTPFKILRKKLERHYNVSIENFNTELDRKTYSVNFDNESIEQVMELFSKMYEMEYKISDNTIIIKDR